MEITKNPQLQALDAAIEDGNEAEWEEFRPDNGNHTTIRCSKCHEWGHTKWDIKTPYCPCCGKKMKNGYKYFEQEEVEDEDNKN